MTPTRHASLGLGLALKRTAPLLQMISLVTETYLRTQSRALKNCIQSFPGYAIQGEKRSRVSYKNFRMKPMRTLNGIAS